jgi:hypothetical protein
MWDNNSGLLGIDRIGFDLYFNDSKKAVGIHLKQVHQLKKEILLSTIRTVMPSFAPPQTFRYLSKFSALRNFRTLQPEWPN